MRSFTLVLLSSLGCAAFAGLAGVPVASAQAPDDVLQGRPDAAPEPADGEADADAAAALGGVFESQSAGIAFRAPAGCREIRHTGGDDIVAFVDEQRKWNLRVSRIQYGDPVPLETAKDEKGKRIPGLLEMRIEQLKLEQPGAELLRDDVVDVGGNIAVGMIAARYNVGFETLLQQQALVRASDRNYYVFTLTTPAPRDGDLSENPDVRKAVTTFNAVLDSVQLIDQSEIKAEQNERLFRTRALFLNLTENRLRNALIKEQWLRLVRDGKDVGYLYVVEEVASDLPKKKSPKRPSSAQGVRIGVRSRTLPEAGVQVDTASWMWMSFDRRHEQWSNRAVIRRGNERTDLGDFGASDMTTSAARGEEQYVLNATHITKTSTAQPVRRDLPVFYVPQALGHLLPRLVPRFEPKGYMFATYVTDNREVMARYVDVEREEEVTLDGKTVRAIPVLDRIGIEGPVTTHYISPDGEYLGSVSAETKITILPSDRATLQAIWKDADLSRPGEVEERSEPATPTSAAPRSGGAGTGAGAGNRTGTGTGTAPRQPARP